MFTFLLLSLVYCYCPLAVSSTKLSQWLVWWMCVRYCTSFRPGLSEASINHRHNIWNKLAQMFTCVRRCVEYMTKGYSLKVKVKLRGHWLQLCVYGIYFGLCLRDFKIISQKHLPQWDGVLHACARSAAQRSRSILQVDLLHFCLPWV